ncbi:MAG: hypothetical protein ABGX16_12250 [Pirellulales bacterium]
MEMFPGNTVMTGRDAFTPATPIPTPVPIPYPMPSGDAPASGPDQMFAADSLDEMFAVDSIRAESLNNKYPENMPSDTSDTDEAFAEYGVYSQDDGASTADGATYLPVPCTMTIGRKTHDLFRW